METIGAKFHMRLTAEKIKYFVKMTSRKRMLLGNIAGLLNTSKIFLLLKFCIKHCINFTKKIQLRRSK